ncbi:hypothetical protein D0T12_22815 [Actinomadura spongiicola]|uniref:Integral membrane protein n=1 Tax=Actinomadura spongiicola TaxID=2303421 RepID=A0A372GCG3_9ACTN|nr:hypothetical protein [Actinomadura spongiicola]RFS83030.1 hypothetical protein D0T12_22815 [Actinomadura spongiicola]
MEFVRLLLLFFHFVGLSVVIGGFLAQLSEARAGRVRPGTGMLHGALTQLVTGVALVGVNEGALDNDMNQFKIGVKLLVVLVVLALILLGRRRPLDKPVFMAIGALALTNVAVAVFWT